MLVVELFEGEVDMVVLWKVLSELATLSLAS